MFVRFRNTVLLALAVVAVSPSLRAQAIAPAKVAIINLQKAVVDTAEIKKAQAGLQAKYQPRQQQLEALQRDLQGIQQQISAPGITPERQAQLQADGTSKQKQAQRINEDLQADFNADRQDILGRAGRQMNEVVRKIAEERGIDVVIDVTTALYFKPGLEITADATTAYDKAYPVK
jgi:outer membrane protein